MKPESPTATTTRRCFLRGSAGALAGAALTSAIAARSHAAEDNTIKVALVGCGGRGTGAALNALSTKGPTKLWAMADFFGHRLQGSLDALAKKFGNKVEVPPERRFVGLDAFKKAIDSLDKGDLVLLATPPAFRPIHLEYAVEKERHVFMEKSFAVDAPGVRCVQRAGEAAAKKNLKIAGGLMWRHDRPREECIKRLHDGEIGDIVLLRTYRMHGPCGYAPKRPGTSELAHQIANYNSFTWLNASFFVDWLIHNIDVCCWAKNAWPVAAQGQGGRSSRTEPDQLFDHFFVEYSFADGARLLAQGRHAHNCYGIFSDFAHGSKGSALIMQDLSTPNPRIWKNQAQVPENETWHYTGPGCDPYQVEHDLLFDAIRQDKPYNEAERCAKTVMVAIMGRMAAESGQMITFDQAIKSDLELAPGLDQYTLESNPPVLPDKDGRYPIAIPGQTKVM
ncbi:MAG: gfo/Idh/MocA family oxidoreductase [Planctomycetota bacterium]|nr:gfo/Idh/MocA family oxidoreductase [Planctomycetota bacterium]